MEYKIGKNKSPRLMMKELVSHRDLFLIFAWRDLKLKYRQTLIGFAWVVLQPLIMMTIFTVVFASRIDTAAIDIPYPVFVFTGLIIYNAFSGGVSTSSHSLVSHAHIIKKIYFPRIILPASSIFIALVDFLASLLILLALLFFTGPGVPVMHFLINSLMAFILVAIPTLGFGILFAGLNVRYRDINFIFPFFLQVMLFISPVIYPVHTVTNPVFKSILMFNPISAAIEYQKAAVQVTYIPDIAMIWMSLGTSFLVLITGILVFGKIEKNFADIV